MGRPTMIHHALSYAFIIALQVLKSDGHRTTPNSSEAISPVTRILNDLGEFENDLASILLRLENRLIFLSETQLAFVRLELENAEKLINTKNNLVVEDVLDAMDKHVEEFDHRDEDDHAELIEELSDVNDILQRTDVLEDSNMDNVKMAEALNKRIKLLQKELDVSQLLSVLYEKEPILRIQDHVRFDHIPIDGSIDDLGTNFETFWKRLRTLGALWKEINMNEIMKMFNELNVS